MFRTWLIAVALVTANAHALYIPKRLSAQDRGEVMQMLGFNTSTKLLTNPYPLGGYSGVEIGLSVEMLDIGDLSHFGCAPGSSGCPNTSQPGQSGFRYPRLTLGKGLYEDVDIFLHVLPPLPGTRITDFGGLFRWSFWQGEYLPANLSLIFHGTRITIQDQFSCQTYGGEIVAGLILENFSLYMGGGYLVAEGQFTGGDTGDGVIDPNDPSLNSATNTVTERANRMHAVVGVTFQTSIFFAAAQVDRYEDSVYSGKVGVRF